MGFLAGAEHDRGGAVWRAGLGIELGIVVGLAWDGGCVGAVPWSCRGHEIVFAGPETGETVLAEVAGRGGGASCDMQAAVDNALLKKLEDCLFDRFAKGVGDGSFQGGGGYEAEVEGFEAGAGREEELDPGAGLKVGRSVDLATVGGRLCHQAIGAWGDVEREKAVGGGGERALRRGAVGAVQRNEDVSERVSGERLANDSGDGDGFLRAEGQRQEEQEMPEVRHGCVISVRVTAVACPASTRTATPPRSVDRKARSR